MFTVPIKMKAIHYLLVSIVLFSCTQAQEQSSEPEQSSCEWCGATEAPPNVQSRTTIATVDEVGQRIKINGTVFLADKKTPAKDVILYLYHTNAKGIYPKNGSESGNGRRHGYLRGWIKTGNDGTYEFETIKPEPYPGRSIPAHIHITIKEPNKNEYWLKDYFFNGDTFLSARDLKNETGEARFNHVINLTQEGNIQLGEREILLKD
ncbi:intradiol ring-cleavage dioxygenase [Ekhidna sp. To15]|uniref:dioxygenase family protein n=1 Tax=Ekhidna sp. To15 TaxID=3395267 RepID=UPI003F523199